MYRYFVADGMIYKVRLEKVGKRYYLRERRLENNRWSYPVSMRLDGQNLTLEKAMRDIYGFPVYYDSVGEAKRAIA